MTEYWVSNKQYWCKYCETYIRDDAPSRRQHENGLRHQGNKERFVRNIYKQGEKAKKDAEEEKREMARIEQAAQAAFSSDVASGRAKHAAAASPAVGPSSKGPAPEFKQKITQTPSAHIKPSTQKPSAPPPPSASFANYSTAESLGFIDPDVERAQAEAARRQTMGIVGDWQVVESAPTPPRPLSSTPAADGEGEEEEKMEDGAEAAVAGQKRPADDDDEGRGWKLRRKTASVGLDEIYDPGIIMIKPRVKQEARADEVSADANAGAALGGDDRGATTAPVEASPQATALPKWAPTKWKKAGEVRLASSASAPAPSSSVMALDCGSVDAAQEMGRAPEESSKPDDVVKTEEAEVKLEGALALAEESPVTVAPAPEEPAPSLFKKRRPPAGSGSRGRRG